jgi:hypothetical protein
MLSEDLGIASAVGDYSGYNAHYEPAVQHRIAEHGLKPEYFHAKQGDLLIWHANLLHGGSPRRDHKLSRKALVCHYIAEGVVSYHDIFGTPSYVQLGLDLYPPASRPRPRPRKGILRRVLRKIRSTVGA